MGHCKSSAKGKKVHSITGLPQETRKNNLLTTPKATREGRNEEPQG